jgi:hypothetical protein
MRDLCSCGFPNGVPGDFNYFAFKKELHLTDEQENEIKNIQKKYNEYIARESHDMPESIPWDLKNKEIFITDCEEEAHNLWNSLGEEKFEDFYQWVLEQNVIDREMDSLDVQKIALSDRSQYSEKLFDDLTNSPRYKTYKEKKAEWFNSTWDAEKFFSKHEKGLKLRIQYTLGCTTLKQNAAKIETNKAIKPKDDIQEQLSNLFE